MDGVSARQLCHPDDFLDRQIAFDRPHVFGQMRPAPNLIGLIRLETVQRQRVFLRPYRHGFHAKLVGGAENTDGDF